MGYGVAGKSVVAFGAAMLLGSVIAAVLLDALTLDLVALAVVWLGLGVSGGSARAARWAVGLMALYLLVAALLLLAGALSPGRLRMAGSPIGPSQLPWALVSFGVAAVWSAVNMALLLRALRSSREAAEAGAAAHPRKPQNPEAGRGGRPANSH